MRSFALALVLLCCGAVRADEPVTLRGATASWVSMIEVGEPGEVSAELSWEASTLLDPERSVLSVWMDGVPRRTVRVTSVDSMEVSLGTLGSGFHRLELRARLHVPGDPCLRVHEDDTWVRVDAVDVRLPQGAEAPSSMSVRAWIAEAAGKTVDVQVPTTHPQTTGRASAIVDAWITLVRWGALPTSEASRTFALHRGPVPQGALAVAHVRDETLELTAQNDMSMARAVRMLRRDALRDRCDHASCIISASMSGVGEQDDALPTLAEQGHPHGWTARGHGRHALQMVWTRPADWKPRAWPTARFDVRAAQLQQGDTTRVSLTIEGVPLGTWEVDEEAAHIAARIPESFWEMDRWELNLEVELEADDETCARSMDRWLHIEGSSHVDVPHDELRFEGIAALAEVRAPSLTADQPVGDTALRALALVLAPFADDHAGWTWVAPDACTSPCVRVAENHWWDESRLELVEHESVLYWRDYAETLDMPMVQANDTVLIEFLEPGDLRVSVVGNPALTEPPTLAGLVGPVAMFRAEQWDVLGTTPPRQVPVEALVEHIPEAPVLTSLEERHTFWIDVGIAGFAMLALGLWLRRKRSFA